MSMQNLFDLMGTDGCHVTVSYNNTSNPTHLWDGDLASGEQSPIFGGQAGIGNEQVQVTVNMDGSVQLDWIGGSTLSDNYNLLVEPNLDTSATAAQLSGMTVHNGGQNQATGWLYEVASKPTVTLSVTGSACSPDPCVFNDIPAGQFVGLRLWMGAAF